MLPKPRSAFRDLEAVHSDEGGLYGSAGDLYTDAVFGRDSIECAEDLLRLRPDIAAEVILRLAELQGTSDAEPGPRSSEEERGKIHHEHRSLFVGERRISARSQQLLEYLSSLWGGDGHTLTYYGSVDATPLYARLVTRYVAAHGPAILSRATTNKDGETVLIGESLLAAIDWVAGKVEASPVGLLEFRRINTPNGHPFQAWKDSGTGYVHRDGSIADFTQPIAAVEVQGYAYDALAGAAQLMRTERPSEAARWLELAQLVREQLVHRLWMPAEGYFAIGLDRAPDGTPRQIESVASNGAVLLETGVFDGLASAREYVEGCARRACAKDLLTVVGIRCRSLVEDGRVGFQDYHGTWAVWQKEGFDIATGLARQGFPRLARELRLRLLNGVNVAGAFVEFLYVSPDQRIAYDFADRDPLSDHPVEILGTNRPEPLQAWTVTGAINAKDRLARDPSPSGGSSLEDDILQRMPRARALRTATERASAYAQRGDFVLNVTAGLERDRAARADGQGQAPPAR